MLSKLIIKNVALIEEAEIAFGSGLNVLSGETGAGKSVILDSVNFVLGAKADRSMIRHGEAECFVKAEFLLSEDSAAVQTLREMDIESDGDIIISRRFSENGKSAIKINGSAVTSAMLRRVTDSLVDVHGQSEHFFLLKEANQLKTLDAVVGAPLYDLKAELAVLLKEKKEILKRMELLGGDEKERGRRLDVLDFQIKEIEAAALQDGEEEELLSRRNKIANMEKIIAALREAIALFSDDNGVLDCIRRTTHALNGISRLDEAYAALSEKTETLSAEAEDISETLSSFADDLYFDENEAETTENRLDVIRSMKRKYGANKAEIDAYLASIRSEYDLLSDCEGQYAVLTERLGKIDRKIYAVCEKMTGLRKEHGAAFCKRVTEELKTLNIANAQFCLDFKPYDESCVDEATTNGMDGVCFLFSANAGEPMKPLGKIISGGEMSRFMLAIKTQLSDKNEISTYIFDEIDAGISGKTAKVVGEKLARIAKDTQIIAVSHLAQIAVMGDHEYLIEKKEENEKTLTHVYALQDEERVREIVRLLGGDEKDVFAEKHALELMKQATAYKASL